MSSPSDFDETYTNDTGLKGDTFFTGSRFYQLKEVEVSWIRTYSDHFVPVIVTSALGVRFADRFRISGDFRRVPRETFLASVPGSRDGFHAARFHRRCDGHANILTLILDTEGNIFGGFTPVEWESHGGDKVDDSQKRFLFTLKNPHNIPTRKFMLKNEKKHQTITCDYWYGPSFPGVRVDFTQEYRWSKF